MLEDKDVRYSVQVYTDCTNSSVPTSGSPALSSPKIGKATYYSPWSKKKPVKVK